MTTPKTVLHRQDGSARRVRLVDVASAAGVSKSVASRALADAPDIGEATKARVQQLAQGLGYHASRRARSLSRRNGVRRTSHAGLVNRHFGPRPVNCVTFTWEEAARDAAMRLAGTGHRHLAMLLPELENTTVIDRYNGWRAGVVEAGLSFDQGPILRYRGSPGVLQEQLEGGRKLSEYLLRHGLPGSGQIPTAIVGFNDWCALGVLRVAAEEGVRVPEQLSVIGFDSTRIGDGTTPPLCSYSPRFIDLGREAATLLAKALRGELAEPRRVRIPIDFVCRASCGPPPTM